MFICFNMKQIKTILADKMSSHKVQIWTVMSNNVCLEKCVTLFYSLTRKSEKLATLHSQFFLILLYIIYVEISVIAEMKWKTPFVY